MVPDFKLWRAGFLASVRIRLLGTKRPQATLEQFLPPSSKDEQTETHRSLRLVQSGLTSSKRQLKWECTLLPVSLKAGNQSLTFTVFLDKTNIQT